MSRQPIVVVLHDGDQPAPEPMAPVAERAVIRPTREDGLAEALRGADVLFAYDFRSRAIPEVWYAADSLRWLHVAAAGVDAVFSDEVRASEVTITNSRGVFDESIAEFVLAQILAFAKDQPENLRRQRQHEWRHRESERITGTRALIVGTGPIGHAIGRLLRAAGLEVSGAGRRRRTGDPDLGDIVGTDGLPAALGRADWVVAIAPLTPRTRGMFNAAAFAAMPPHARFLNVGRGELVVTDDLVDALRAGTIAGAAIDVVDPEPLPADHPLWDLENVLITPHQAGDFIGWEDALVHLFAKNFVRWVEGGEPDNVVDKNLGYVPGDGSRT